MFNFKQDKPDNLNDEFIENDIDDEEGEYDSEKNRNLNEDIYEFNSKLTGFGLESFRCKTFKKLSKTMDYRKHLFIKHIFTSAGAFVINKRLD